VQEVNKHSVFETGRYLEYWTKRFSDTGKRYILYIAEIQWNSTTEDACE